MSTIKCNWSECDQEVEFSCNCASSHKYFCREHCESHCISSKGPHNSISLFHEPVEGTKEAILSFLEVEKSKIEEIKANLIASFTQTLCSYKNIFKQVLKVIDSDSTKIGSYAEKIWKTQKLSRLEKDPALNLLVLQSNDAVDRAKIIFEAWSASSIELFCEIGRQIDIIIKCFDEEKFKFIPDKIQFDLKNNEMEEKSPKLKKYKEAIRIDPYDADAYFSIGNILKNEKRYSESLKYYDAAITINPYFALYYTYKGNALYHLNWGDEAMQCYKEAIRIDPNDDDAYNGIGNILKNEKRYQEAVKHYNDAIRINPNKALYYTNKGTALDELGKRLEAKECLLKAIRIDPNDVDAYIGIGNIFYVEERYREAIKYYNDAIRINPNNRYYYYNKGLALKESGRRDEAMECFKEAIRISPRYVDAYNEIGNILYNEERYEEAVKYYNEAIKINPYYCTKKEDALRKLGRR